jgi:uncharacterized protein
MDFEWDEKKRLKALLERGLDFADVALFEPSSLQIKRDDRLDYGETRNNTVGYLNGVLCTYCWTPRNRKIRIISLRKANDRERKKYFKNRSQTSDNG